MSRVICDEKMCSGCLACIVACLDQHYEETATDAIPCRIHEQKIRENGFTAYVTRSCLHCEEPACVAVCPTEALVKRESGIVVPVRENCIGCRACEAACPHDVPRFDNEGKLVKCDSCYERVEAGLEPACVRTCNTGALSLE